MGQGNKPRLFEGIQKQKIGHQCKIGLGGKTGTRKKTHGKSLFSLFVSVIVFAISCFFSRNGS